jgi:hypothetical protein
VEDKMEDTITICPYCDIKRYKNDTCCYKCGFDFEKGKLAKEDKIVEQSIPCPHCGKEIPEDDKDYEASAIKCRFCGKWIENTYIFSSDWSYYGLQSEYWQKKPRWFLFVVGVVCILISARAFFSPVTIAGYSFLLLGTIFILRSFGPPIGFGRYVALASGGGALATIIAPKIFYPKVTGDDLKILITTSIIASIALLWIGFKRPRIR